MQNHNVVAVGFGDRVHHRDRLVMRTFRPDLEGMSDLAQAIAMMRSPSLRRMSNQLLRRACKGKVARQVGPVRSSRIDQEHKVGQRPRI